MRPRRAHKADETATEPPRRPKTRQEQRDDLLAYAFRALGARALSAHELRVKLERRSDDLDLITEILARVQELGYQQDTQVAQIEATRRGLGQYRVRQTMQRRGLTTQVIEETLRERNPEHERAQATELLTRRWPSLARKRDPRASAYALLARRGYPSQIIWAAIGEVSANSETGELREPAEE